MTTKSATEKLLDDVASEPLTLPRGAQEPQWTFRSMRIPSTTGQRQRFALKR